MSGNVCVEGSTEVGWTLYPKFGSNTEVDDTTYTPMEYEKVYYSHNEVLGRSSTGYQVGPKKWLEIRGRPWLGVLRWLGSEPRNKLSSRAQGLHGMNTLQVPKRGAPRISY